MNLIKSLINAFVRLFASGGKKPQAQSTGAQDVPQKPEAAPAPETAPAVEESAAKPFDQVPPASQPPLAPPPAPESPAKPFDQVPPASEPAPAPAPAPESAAKPFDQVPPAQEPAPVAETRTEEVSVAEEPPAPAQEPAPAAEAEQRDFKNTPEKKALDELVLEALKEFQEKELAEGRQLMLTRFVQHFEKKNKTTLKVAIKQASAKSGLPPNATNAKVYLSEVPGVEVFEQGLTTCVCLAGTPVERTEHEAKEEPAQEEEEIPNLNYLLNDILKYASWSNDDGVKMLAAVQNRLKTYYPEYVAEGKRYEKKGRRLRQILDQAYHAGAKKTPFEEIQKMLKEADLNNRFYEGLIRKSYDQGGAASRRWAEARSLQRKMKSAQSAKGASAANKGAGKTAATKEGAGKAAVLEAFDKMFESAQASKNAPKELLPDNASMSQSTAASSPVISIGGGRENALTSMAPSAEWTVMIDETGSNFSSDATGKGRGRLVALFVPRERPLADLPKGWHAVEQGRLEGADGVMDLVGRIQSAKCGLLGIPISLLPYTTQQDQWFSCLEELLALAIRLLPMNGNTKLSLFVEQRGVVAGATGTVMLDKTITDVLHRLSLVFPERAKQITVDGKVIRKDEHPWNGYVDAAAYTWGSPTMQFILIETGWLGSCFLDQESTPILRRALDALRSEDIPDARDWRKLLALVDADNEASLVASFLKALGREAQANVEVWKNFLDEVRSHLDSKAIDMKVLGRQLQWLKTWAPADAAMPPRLHLAWLASELATSNHTGRTDLHGEESFRREFDVLVSQLYREDCPLVAHANLHLAVSYTNAFEFEKARDLLQPMREWPVEGMGLRMKGRLLSSLGQHEAFLGNPVGALPLFDEAISLFRDLSEASVGEIAQTGAYAATAAMDAKTPDADDRLAAYLWSGPFSNEKFIDEARRLATSSKPIEKYAHHILLRRLVELPENHPARVAYLSQKSKWAEPTVGHPWELIEFYRALLLTGDERADRLESAYELALADDNGPTLQVIAAVIKGSAFCIEGAKADSEAYGNLVACCAEALPALGEPRLAALRGQLDPATRLSPLALARAVLPFNFR